VIKVCLLLVFFQLVFDVFFNVLIFFQPIFIVVSLGSMIVGSLGALKQIRIKRFLAYTSINQVGFIILGFSSCSLMGLVSAIMYLSLYVVMNLSFFGIFLHIEHVLIKRNVIYLSDLYGISKYSNESAVYLAITILSMGGLPPLGGFFGKLFIYFSAIEARLDFALMITLLMSILSTYYYLNFVRYIFFEKRFESKLYYFVKNTKLIVCLRLCSIFLISFPILLSIYFEFFVKVSFSCL
jgi:NADH-quinone oxidoreductase subunit N